jgi:hypothetical protein
MDLERYWWELVLPECWNRWHHSGSWAGRISNIVSESFAAECPRGTRILYAHSAGVDATKRGIEQKLPQRMYDDLNLFNGRTPAVELKSALAASGYSWWQVKVFTNVGDLPSSGGSHGSLSNHGTAKQWAGEAWVHLHCTNIGGHGALVDAIDRAGEFAVSLDNGSKLYIGTVEEMMIKDWRLERNIPIWAPSIIPPETTINITWGFINLHQQKSRQFVIDSSVTKAAIVAYWGGSHLELVVIDPDGQRITPDLSTTDPDIEYIEGSTNASYTLNELCQASGKRRLLGRMFLSIASHLLSQ